MYHGQRRPASRGTARRRPSSRSPRIPPGRSAWRIARRSSRVGQVLDHVPDRDRVVVPRGHRRVLDGAVVHRSGDAVARDLGCPPRRLDAAHLESALLGELEERPDVAADVQQPALRHEPLRRAQALGEGRDAALLLLEVADVLDLPVRVLHLLVVRPRVHVDEAAAAALDDPPEAPRTPCASTCSASAGRRGPLRRGVETDAVVVRVAQRAAHVDVVQRRRATPLHRSRPGAPPAR